MKEFTEEKDKGRDYYSDNNRINNNRNSKQDKLETFNVSMGDDLENQLYQTQNQKNWKVIFLIVMIILIGLLALVFYHINSNDDIMKVCEPGYFIPQDDTTKSKCEKCSVENCNKCEGTKLTNKCILCNEYLTPIYEENEIKQCKYTCET